MSPVGYFFAIVCSSGKCHVRLVVASSVIATVFLVTAVVVVGVLVVETVVVVFFNKVSIKMCLAE